MKYFVTAIPYLLFIAHTVYAQEVVPVHEEPRHHLVYDNDTIQILDVQIPPGDTTLYHTHDAAFLSVMISASSIDDQVPGGEWKEVITASTLPSIKTGDVFCNLDYADHPATHRVRNAGDRLFHLIGVINKRNLSASRTVQNGHELPGNSEEENPWFYQSRSVVAPGESIFSRNSNSPVVIVQAGEGKLQVLINGDEQKSLSSPGDFAVAESSLPFEIVNEGSSPAEIVVIRVI